MEKPLKKKQLIDLEFEFSDMQEIPNNPQFSYGKAKILYTGLNRNNSFITEDSTKKALPTLFGIPIVGEYIEETDNFGSHGGKIEVTDKGVKYIDTTTPFGYVSENSKVYWETVTEVNGQQRDYFVADRCVFWTGRYPQLNTLFNNGKFNQSMEIDVNEGSFAVIDGNETFRIDDFTFSALCILGINTPDDPNGHVEPCFEEASIEVYESPNNFQLKFNQMITEFNSNPEGGQPVVVELKKEEKFEEATEVVETVETTEEVIEEVTETVETKVEEFTTTEEVVEEETTEEETVEEVTETIEETVVEEFEEKTEPEIQVSVEQYTALQNKLVLEQASSKKLADSLLDADAKFADLEKETITLREFKRNTELTALAEKFSGKLADDIIKSTIEANAEKSIEDLEGMIFAEIGKQNFSLSTKEKQVEKFSMQVSDTDDNKTAPYGGLFAKHGENK